MDYELINRFPKISSNIEAVFSDQKSRLECFCSDLESITCDQSGVYNLDLNIRNKANIVLNSNVSNYQKINLNINILKDSVFFLVVHLKIAKEAVIKMDFNIIAKQSSKIDVLFVNDSEGVTELKSLNVLEEKDITLSVDILSIQRKKSRSDLMVTNKSNAQGNVAEINEKIILLDQSSSVVQGQPYLSQNALNNRLYLSQKVLLLSSYAQIKLIPLLFVANSQSESSHSASVDRFSEDDLFYLSSRGLGLNTIQKIFIEAFLNNSFDKIMFPKLRNCLVNSVKEPLINY